MTITDVNGETQMYNVVKSILLRNCTYFSDFILKGKQTCIDYPHSTLSTLIYFASCNGLPQVFEEENFGIDDLMNIYLANSCEFGKRNQLGLINLGIVEEYIANSIIHIEDQYLLKLYSRLGEHEARRLYEFHLQKMKQTEKNYTAILGVLKEKLVEFHNLDKFVKENYFLHVERESLKKDNLTLARQFEGLASRLDAMDKRHREEQAKLVSKIDHTTKENEELRKEISALKKAFILANPNSLFATTAVEPEIPKVACGLCKVEFIESDTVLIKEVNGKFCNACFTTLIERANSKGVTLTKGEL